MRRALSVLIAATMLVGVVALPASASGSKTITERVAGDSRFDILEKLVVDAGLADALADPSADLTVFAPLDWSFRKLVFELTGDRDLAFTGGDRKVAKAIQDFLGGPTSPALVNILLYHVSGELGAIPYSVAKVQNDLPLMMLNGGTVIVDSKPGKGKTLVELTDEADRKMLVTRKDIHASNGIIHGIGKVLLPGS